MLMNLKHIFAGRTWATPVLSGQLASMPRGRECRCSWRRLL